MSIWQLEQSGSCILICNVYFYIVTDLSFMSTIKIKVNKQIHAQNNIHIHIQYEYAGSHIVSHIQRG